MIFSLAIAAILGTSFFAIGSFIYRFVGPRVDNPLLAEMARLTGMAAAFALASIAYELNLPPLALLGVLAILTAVGVANLRTEGGLSGLERLNTFLRVRITAFIAAGYYVFIMQGSFGNVWTFRTGPDSFGWGGSALSICRGDTLASLTQRVQGQLNGTDLIASFMRPVKVGETSIAQISSFSDQAAAEFLIGAQRTGLPKLLGDLCTLSGNSFFAHLFVAFVALSVYISVRIMRRIGRELGLKPWLADIISLAAVISVGPLSVTLEGGYGQLVTLPFFILAMAFLQRKIFDGDALVYSVALLGVAAMSSYLDLLYLAIPMLAGIYLCGLLAKQYPLIKIKWHHVYLALGALIVSWPMLKQVARLVFSAASNPRAGGWHQGNFFFPDNLVGLYSSLPVGRYEILPRTGFDLGADLLLSAIVIGFVIFTLARQRILGIFLLLGYVYLTIGVYSDMAEPNNYRIWKYSAYAASLFGFVMMGVVASARAKAPSIRAVPVQVSGKLKNVGLAIALVSSLLSSLFYGLDWKASSSLTADGGDKQLVKTLAPEYDLAFGPGLYSTMFTMFGDVRFATLKRGGPDIGNVVRDADKPLAVILSNETMPTLELLNSVADGQTYVRFQELAKGDTLTAYLLSRD